MSFSLKPALDVETLTNYPCPLSILFFMSFSLKPNTICGGRSWPHTPLSILFFMSFSLKLFYSHEIDRKYLISQSSFSWAFLWNLLETVYGKEKAKEALNPLFHELFSETFMWCSQGTGKGRDSQSSFSWAFLWNHYRSPKGKMDDLTSSQSSFSWAFLWNVHAWLPREVPLLVSSLNPLFHELFSET